jgi:membrane protein DedA with SNARE-associated domain
MIDFLDHAIQNYGYGVVGLAICLEAMGLPLPGESLLIGSAIYAATTHKIAIEWTLVAAAIGAIMGDNFGYLIGMRLGRPALEKYGPKIYLTVERQRLGQYLFLRYGGIVVFFARFVAFMRTFAALLAGANRMPWGRFLVWNALGGIAWTHLYGLGAYALGTEARKIAGPVGIVIGSAALLLAFAVIWFLKRNEHRLIVTAKEEMQAHEQAVAARKAGRKPAKPDPIPQAADADG